MITYKKGTKEKKSNATQRTNNDSRPRWLVKLESKITVLRKEISQLSEEIRTKYNMKMSKRRWKNRMWIIKKELKGKVTLESLTILKEKRINMIRKLKNERRNQIITMKTSKGNHTFDQDPGKFYGHLRDILNQDKDKEKPKYEENRSSNNSKQTSSLTKEDFEKFWVPIWQNDQEGNLTSDWITEVRKALKEASPTQDNSPITITKKTKYNCVKKKKNWTSPGIDKITNFWIKEFSTLHAPLADAIINSYSSRTRRI